MGYSIIFETKFVKLADGRLLHLDRSGCNNDTAGRDLSDFSGTIYTENKLKEKVNHYNEMSSSEGWDLKIGSKHVTYKDYGDHLLRMAKKALPYDEFMSQRICTATRYDGVTLLEPEQKDMTAKEFDKEFYDYLYGNKPFSYRRRLTELKGETEIITALENKEPVTFYVGKKF